MAGDATDHEVQATIDRVALDALQRAYADGVTQRDWDRVSGLFTPDATVALDLVTRPARTIEGPQSLVEFIATAIERFAFFEFVILNSNVELWPDGDRSRATATIFMCELRLQQGSTERDDAFGRYRDSYRKVDGTWRIERRAYRSMARFPSGEVFPLDP